MYLNFAIGQHLFRPGNITSAADDQFTNAYTDRRPTYVLN